MNLSVSNWHLSLKLFVIAAVMFGFGYAMIPLYRAICEITGVGLITQRDEDAAEFARNTQVDTSRKVTIEFDANSRGTWQFKPKVSSVSVNPGELVTVVYQLTNTESRPTVGQAIPSYAPQVANRYFRKLECFCFKQQALEPNEVREFPVVFVIDPKLPTDVSVITLSDTFFEVPGQSLKPSDAAATPGAGTPAGTPARGT